MSVKIEVTDYEDAHIITVSKPRTPIFAILPTESVGIHPVHQEFYERRFRIGEDVVDGDKILADFIASIPPGTATLKEIGRRRAIREAGPA